MERIVPDASIIIKWALGGEEEPEKDKAMSILFGFTEGKFEIILPSLWIYEVGNVLGMRYPQSGEEIMGILLGYEFNEFSMSKDLCRLIFQLMNEFKVTFYDASYHALAIHQKGKFITSDKKYFEKAKDKAYIQLLDFL